MGSMRDSTIFVTVRSRFAGRKFLTLEIRLSRVEGTRVVEARRFETRDENPLKRSPPVEVVAAVCCDVCVVVIMVIRVTSRTLGENH